MGFLLNPISSIKAIVVSLALAVLAGAGGAWFGWSARGDRLNVERANMIIEYGKTLASLSDKIVKLDAEKQLESKNHAETNARYHAALRAGTVRLSVPSRAVQPADPAASGVDQETRAELDPEAAVRIDEIVNDGDNAILDLNQCIDQYEEVRRRLNQGS